MNATPAPICDRAVSVVVPVYNEEAGIDELMRRVEAVCAAQYPDDY